MFGLVHSTASLADSRTPPGRERFLGPRAAAEVGVHVCAWLLTSELGPACGGEKPSVPVCPCRRGPIVSEEVQRLGCCRKHPCGPRQGWGRETGTGRQLASGMCKPFLSRDLFGVHGPCFACHCHVVRAWTWSLATVREEPLVWGKLGQGPGRGQGVSPCTPMKAGWVPRGCVGHPRLLPRCHSRELGWKWGSPDGVGSRTAELQASLQLLL